MYLLKKIKYDSFYNSVDCPLVARVVFYVKKLVNQNMLSPLRIKQVCT